MNKFTSPISYAVITDFTADGLPLAHLRPCLLVIGSNSCLHCRNLIPEIYKLIDPLIKLNIKIIIAQPFDGATAAERALVNIMPLLLGSKTINLPTLVFVNTLGMKYITEGFITKDALLSNLLNMTL